MVCIRDVDMGTNWEFLFGRDGDGDRIGSSELLSLKPSGWARYLFDQVHWLIVLALSLRERCAMLESLVVV